MGGERTGRCRGCRFAGRAALRQGDADPALAPLDHAVQLRPDDFELRLDRAMVLGWRVVVAASVHFIVAESALGRADVA